MKYWQQIRRDRSDITDYVIHLTKNRYTPTWPDRPGNKNAWHVFCEIIEDGYIRSSFAPVTKINGKAGNTVRGPSPAICLTEQPLSSILETNRNFGDRYSGFGIAYHKYAFFNAGGMPVIYGPESLLGRRLSSGEPGYQEDREIFTGGLPAEFQFLWVRYSPGMGDSYPADFTWEREWRIKCDEKGLPLYLNGYDEKFKGIPVGALVVERDEHIEWVRKTLAAKVAQGIEWAGKFTKIVSLQTVERMLKAGEKQYGRIETYPDSTALFQQSPPA